MKIFNAGQLYEADKTTIHNQGISSEELMERAAVEIFNWLHRRLQGAQLKIHIFCGIGNNGGDGLAVARHLWEHGYDIAVHVVSYSDKRSEDFLSNLEKLKSRKIWPNYLQENSALPEIDPGDMVLDAIFGIGLNREPYDWVAKVIQSINTSGAFVLSVDVPSGLYVDKPIDNPDAVVRANFVLSIQAPKLVFFLPQTGIYSEDWTTLDIGMDRNYLAGTETEYELTTREEVLNWYKPRDRFSHKGNYGHALIVGGSYGKVGAVILSSRACLATGSGLVTSYVPKCGYIPLQTALAEAMVLTDSHNDIITDISVNFEPTVVGIGIGMGIEKETRIGFEKFLDTYKGPLVIDADGLNILSKERSLLDKLPAQTVLTPHPGELKRLIGSWASDFEKLEKAIEFSGKYDLVLVMKDSYTIVVYDGKGYINSTGNPGMATGGSGDVLTGMITALLAQGYEALIAARMAVYLHGRAGDLASQEYGYESLTAGTITDYIAAAFLDLFEKPERDSEENNNKEES